jgi:hypothetical protein
MLLTSNIPQLCEEAQLFEEGQYFESPVLAETELPQGTERAAADVSVGRGSSQNR